MAPPVRYREFRFPVEIDWDAGKRTVARIDGKPPLADRDSARVSG